MCECEQMETRPARLILKFRTYYAIASAEHVGTDFKGNALIVFRSIEEHRRPTFTSETAAVRSIETGKRPAEFQEEATVIQAVNDRYGMAPRAEILRVYLGG